MLQLHEENGFLWMGGWDTYCADALTDFLWMGGQRNSQRKCSGYFFMNGRTPNFIAQACNQNFMNGRMGSFSSQGQCRRGLHEWTSYAPHAMLFIYVCTCPLIHSVRPILSPAIQMSMLIFHLTLFLWTTAISNTSHKIAMEKGSSYLIYFT